MTDVYDLIIVGGGPRAVSTLERLDAWIEAEGSAPITVAIIDAVEIGAGATWRTDQTRQFLNNTTSNATTIYPDESTVLVGPLRKGPTFVDWAQEIVARGSHPLDWVLAEAREVTPGSFPTRRLQGVYYNEQLERFSATGRIELTKIRSLAIDVLGPEGTPGSSPDTRTVTLADGRTLTARTVILAQGMVQAVPDASIVAATTAAERFGLTYIAPGMPAEKPWETVPAEEQVIVQGLGANFFDVVAELTAGRGGAFTPVAGDPHGRLQYIESGHEPSIVAVSRRGVPYRSKGDFGDAKPAPYVPRIATVEWFEELSAREQGSVDFAREVWPVIAAEFAYAWASATLAREPEHFTLSLDALEQRLRGAAYTDQHAEHRAWRGAVPHIDAVMLESFPEAQPHATFTVDSLRRPTRGERVSADAWESFVRRLVDAELDSLAEPVESPRQAVNRAMGALRGRASRLAVQGILTAESVVLDVHGWFNADGLFLASGPPASRVREVLALIESGVVRLLGPHAAVSIDEEAQQFTATSAITGQRVTTRHFVETRMSKGKVPNTNDPLLRALLDRGDARVHTLADASGVFETESLEALPRDHAELPLSIVNAEGVADPRILVLGIPAQSTQPGSAIGATPGLSSPLLAGADRAACRVLELRARDSTGVTRA